jgi:segregation and condensation protein B
LPDAAVAEAPIVNEERSPAPRRRRDQVAPADPSKEIVEAIEVVIFSSDRPLPDARLAELLELPAEPAPSAVIEVAMSRLNDEFERTGRVYRIRRLAGGWRAMVQPRHHDLIERLKGQRSQAKLSPAALETLAIVAYRQPIVRAEIEAIRGVASGEVLRSLMDRRLVRITGRAEELGRPMLYGTTREFLQVFGLASLTDLPQRREFAGDSKPAKASAGKSRKSREETAAADSPAAAAPAASHGDSTSTTPSPEIDSIG